MEEYQEATRLRFWTSTGGAVGVALTIASFSLGLDWSVAALLLGCGITANLIAFFSYRLATMNIARLRSEFQKSNDVCRHTYRVPWTEDLLDNIGNWSRLNEANIQCAIVFDKSPEYRDQPVAALFSFPDEETRMLFRMKWL